MNWEMRDLLCLSLIARACWRYLTAPKEGESAEHLPVGGH